MSRLQPEKKKSNRCNLCGCSGTAFRCRDCDYDLCEPCQKNMARRVMVKILGKEWVESGVDGRDRSKASQTGQFKLLLCTTIIDQATLQAVSQQLKLTSPPEIQMTIILFFFDGPHQRRSQTYLPLQEVSTSHRYLRGKPRPATLQQAISIALPPTQDVRFLCLSSVNSSLLGLSEMCLGMGQVRDNLFKSI